MKLLFVHQNMPGQYREMLHWLVARGQDEIVFLTQKQNAPRIPGVTTVRYAPHSRPERAAGYGLSAVWETAAAVGLGAVQAAQKLERDMGFRPDIVLGHTGWGELLFFKQLWPDVPVLGYFEYFYNLTGGMQGFDPEEKPGEFTPYLTRARNTVPFMNLDAVDLGQVPTLWQRDTYPEVFHDRLYTCHDGVRTDRLLPDPDAILKLSRLERPLTREDEVFTYVVRNLERARGFHVFMQALPEILEARPNARAVIVGGNETSYGPAHQQPGGLRAEMEREYGDRIDWSRVHFLGRVPYPDFIRIVQVSRCHIYLTMPFVPGWSLIEAMSMQATVVASDVAPVREILSHGETGLLVDFFDASALAQTVSSVLESPGDFAHLGRAAREQAVERYDFQTRCLPEHLRRIDSLLPAGRALAEV